MATKVVLFNGIGADAKLSLWKTDGTPGGTSEIVVASVDGTGLDPTFITNYNGVALLDGQDSSGKFGLWVTNGTGAGTTEVGGAGSAAIFDADPGDAGLHPQYLQAYNGEVLFSGRAGLAGAAVSSLWITDGTVAGTSEIGGAKNAGVHNAFSGGLLAVGDPGFTPFNGKVLFKGRDSANNVGLWVTDGTAAGTTELAPIAGAFAVGTPGSDVQPQYMAVLGSQVLFDGADQEDTEGSLWVTNGTAAGTKEIGGEGNKGIAEAPFHDPAGDLPIGIAPYGLTTLNGKVIFAGTDDTTNGGGHYVHTTGLWVSDGTVGGTFEIGGLGNAAIMNANPAQDGGLFWEGSIAHPDFTVLNDKAFFIGLDASQSVHIGLWVTDGTAGGTVEIGGLGNAGVSGSLHFGTSENPDFVVFGNEVLFNALDASNHEGLWVSDGTVGGTKEIPMPTAPNLTPTDMTVFTAGPNLFVNSVLHTTSGGSDLKAGGVVSIALVMNEAATVTGVPKLVLSNGATATYASGSGTSTLVFKYTVAAGQNSPTDLQIASTSLTGATIKDAGGFNADLSGALGADLGVIVDTTVPTVTGNLVESDGGFVGLNQTAAIILNVSEPVTVVGAPTLKLSDTGAATFDAANSTSTKLVFDYTAVAKQSSADLKITSLTLPKGTTITDGAGNALSPALTSAVADLHVVVDTTPPTVKVTASPASGAVANGSIVTITLTASEIVTVTGTPSLTMNDGGVATYVSGSGTKTLVFQYHVGAESTTDLRVTGINENGTPIKDQAGNLLSSTLAADLKLQANVFTFSQTTGGGGDWDTATNWSPASLPGSTATALITKPGTYTVTSNQANTVSVVDTAAGATLAVGAATLTATNGTGTGISAGKVAVGDGATLKLGGTFDNTGSITLNGSAQPTRLVLGSSLTLSGAGKLILADNSGGTIDNFVGSNGTAVTLTNSNSISGAGTIGDGLFTLSNLAAGVINGNGTTHALTLSATTFNTGVIEGTTAQGLAITGTVASNSKTIQALGTGAKLFIKASITNASTGVIGASGSGAHVDIAGNATIIGGTLKMSGTGAVIDVLSGVTAVINGVTIGSGTVEALTNGALMVTGVVKNAGTLFADGGTVDLANTTLTGGTLGVSGAGAAMEVTNGNSATISGVTITGGSTVEALTGGTLTVTGTVKNAGTLFASGGTLDIAGAVTGGTAAVAFGGAVEIAQASSTEAVTFNLGDANVVNKLVLDHAQTFHGKVSGFGANGNTVEYIDLEDLSFASFNPATGLTYTPNATNTAGTLKVTDGTHTANIQLVGSYATGNFHAANDGLGGIKITDPPVAAAPPASTDAVVALFANHIAASFAEAPAGFGQGAIHESSQFPAPAPLAFGRHA